MTGYTASTEASFPVTVSPDLSNGGAFDAFVAKIATDGRRRRPVIGTKVKLKNRDSDVVRQTTTPGETVAPSERIA